MRWQVPNDGMNLPRQMPGRYHDCSNRHGAPNLRDNLRHRRMRSASGMARFHRVVRMVAVIGSPIILFAIGIALYPRQFPDRSWTTEAAHMIASANCAMARVVGLAAAYRGQPGYWPHLDADHDGIACEPWPRSAR